MIGKVSFWSNLKGYGFIVGPEQGEDLFCHHSALLEGRSLEKNAMVEYEVGEHRRKKCAKNVRKLPPPIESASPATVGGNFNEQ